MASRTRIPARTGLDGVVRGVLVGTSASGEPLIDYPANPTGAPVPARSTVRVNAGQTGGEAVLMFEDGDPCRPILIGLIEEPVTEKHIEADQERITIRADREIVLRCGDASITLTRAGKVIIQGAYVVSRSSGTNRIKGASVQIN